MSLFNFSQKEGNIIFSDENVAKLIRKSDLLGQTLINNSLGFYVDYLSEIRLAAENRDESKFVKLILSNKMLGGSGSLSDIYLKNEGENQKFEKQFSDYIRLLIQMGVKNKHLKQIVK